MATVKELKAQAKAKGIKGFSTMKKAELEKALGGGGAKPKVVIKKVGKFPLSKTSSDVITIKKALSMGSGTLDSRATNNAKGILARAGIGIRGNKYIDLDKLSPEKQRDYLQAVRDGGKKAATPPPKPPRTKTKAQQAMNPVKQVQPAKIKKIPKKTEVIPKKKIIVKKAPAAAAEPAPKKKRQFKGRRGVGVPANQERKGADVIMSRISPNLVAHYKKEGADIEDAATYVFNNLRKRKTPVDVNTAPSRFLEDLVEKKLSKMSIPAPKPYLGTPTKTNRFMKAPAPAKKAPAKKAPAPAKKASASSPQQVVSSFPFKKSSGGRPLGLDEDDLRKFAVDSGPGSGGFVFLTKAQLLKRLTRAAAQYRPGGFYSGKLGEGFREMFDEQEKYIKDGKYNPPKGVIAELVKKGKNTVPEYFDKPIPLARYKKSKQ